MENAAQARTTEIRVDELTPGMVMVFGDFRYRIATTRRDDLAPRSLRITCSAQHNQTESVMRLPQYQKIAILELDVPALQAPELLDMDIAFCEICTASGFDATVHTPPPGPAWDDDDPASVHIVPDSDQVAGIAIVEASNGASLCAGCHVQWPDGIVRD